MDQSNNFIHPEHPEGEGAPVEQEPSEITSGGVGVVNPLLTPPLDAFTVDDAEMAAGESPLDSLPPRPPVDPEAPNVIDEALRSIDSAPESPNNDDTAELPMPDEQPTPVGKDNIPVYSRRPEGPCYSVTYRDKRGIEHQGWVKAEYLPVLRQQKIMHKRAWPPVPTTTRGHGNAGAKSQREAERDRMRQVLIDEAEEHLRWYGHGATTGGTLGARLKRLIEALEGRLSTAQNTISDLNEKHDSDQLLAKQQLANEESAHQATRESLEQQIAALTGDIERIALERDEARQHVRQRGEIIARLERIIANS